MSQYLVGFSFAKRFQHSIYLFFRLHMSRPLSQVSGVNLLRLIAFHEAVCSEASCLSGPESSFEEETFGGAAGVCSV